MFGPALGSEPAMRDPSDRVPFAVAFLGDRVEKTIRRQAGPANARPAQTSLRLPPHGVNHKRSKNY